MSDNLKDYGPNGLAEPVNTDDTLGPEFDEDGKRRWVTLRVPCSGHPHAYGGKPTDEAVDMGAGTGSFRDSRDTRNAVFMALSVLSCLPQVCIAWWVDEDRHEAREGMHAAIRGLYGAFDPDNRVSAETRRAFEETIRRVSMTVARTECDDMHDAAYAATYSCRTYDAEEVLLDPTNLSVHMDVDHEGDPPYTTAPIVAMANAVLHALYLRPPSATDVNETRNDAVGHEVGFPHGELGIAVRLLHDEYVREHLGDRTLRITHVQGPMHQGEYV